MNTYKDSSGRRWTQDQIERKTTKAKAQLLEEQREEYGYNFCSTCERNDCKPVTCAHVVSVKEAKETGRTELCWSVPNMVPEGLPCHQERDGLAPKFNNH